MTTQDQNKKTLRSFQCRDYLWELFEQMSTELECSTDYLINEAMRQYARSRNYGTARSEHEQATNPAAELDSYQAGRADQAYHSDHAAEAANGTGPNGIPSLRDSARAAQPTPPPAARPRAAGPGNLTGSSPDVAQSGIASLPA